MYPPLPPAPTLGGAGKFRLVASSLCLSLRRLLPSLALPLVSWWTWPCPLVSFGLFSDSRLRSSIPISCVLVCSFPFSGSTRRGTCRSTSVLVTVSPCCSCYAFFLSLSFCFLSLVGSLLISCLFFSFSSFLSSVSCFLSFLGGGVAAVRSGCASVSWHEFGFSGAVNLPICSCWSRHSITKPRGA